MSRQNKIIQALGMAAILTLGFGIAILILAVWIISIYETTYEKRKYNYEEIIVLKDGTPIIHNYGFYDGATREEYHTLEGKTLPFDSDFREKQMSMWYYPGPDELEILTGRLEGLNRIKEDVVGKPRKTFWYFIDDGSREGKGYFIGYDAESKRCIGCLGRKGFCRNVPPSEEQFIFDSRKLGSVDYITLYDESNNMPLVFLISGKQLLKVDLPSQMVTSMMESPDMVCLGRLYVDNADQEKALSHDLIYRHYLLAVRTSDRVIFINAAGKQVHDYIIPQGLRNSSFDLYCLDDKQAIITCKKQQSELNYNEEIVWTDASGKILRQKEVDLALSGYIRPSKIDNREIALAIPAPIAAIIVGTIANPNKYLHVHFHQAVTRYLSDTWQVLIVLCAVSAVLAWFCYRRQRRMELPWTWEWVGFVFLFGVPGFWGYLYHRRWPVLDNCQVCGHAVPHDREKCSSCGSEFPRPAPKGIEVFA
jgi:hypothetical protein